MTPRFPGSPDVYAIQWPSGENAGQMFGERLVTNGVLFPSVGWSGLPSIGAVEILISPDTSRLIKASHYPSGLTAFGRPSSLRSPNSRGSPEPSLRIQ